MSVQETRMQTIIIFDIAFVCASGTEITHFSFNVTKRLSQANMTLVNILQTFHYVVCMCVIFLLNKGPEAASPCRQIKQKCYNRNWK